MSEPWTETVRRVGDNPGWHYEISPDPDGCVVAFDNCVLCGQRVVYIDIDALRRTLG